MAKHLFAITELSLSNEDFFFSQMNANLKTLTWCNIKKNGINFYFNRFQLNTLFFCLWEFPLWNVCIALMLLYKNYYADFPVNGEKMKSLICILCHIANMCIGKCPSNWTVLPAFILFRYSGLLPSISCPTVVWMAIHWFHHHLLFVHFNSSCFCVRYLTPHQLADARATLHSSRYE